MTTVFFFAFCFKYKRVPLAENLAYQMSDGAVRLNLVGGDILSKLEQSYTAQCLYISTS